MVRPDVIEVWCLPLERAPLELADRLSILSDDERARAARFLDDRDRADFVMVRSALRSLLGNRLRTSARTIPLGLSQQGKPCLTGDASVRFNVSHASGMAIIGIASGRNIGVDIEHRRWAPALLPTRVLTARESDRVRNAKDPVAAFFDHWTMKEALLKGRGTGLAAEPRALEVMPGAPQTVGDFVVQNVGVADGYSAAVAVQRRALERPFAIRVRSW